MDMVESMPALYRPFGYAGAHRLLGTLDQSGNPLAWGVMVKAGETTGSGAAYPTGPEGHFALEAIPPVGKLRTAGLGAQAEVRGSPSAN